MGKKRKVRLGEFESYEAVPIKTTLIVVPANLRAQWASEMQCHMDPDALTWYAASLLLKLNSTACPEL